MVSVYQIGAILFVAVGVLGSALMLAWRDANRAPPRALIREDQAPSRRA